MEYKSIYQIAYNIRKAEHTWHATHNYVSDDYEETFFFKYLAKK